MGEGRKLWTGRLKLAVGLLISLLALAALYVAILVSPAPLFAHHREIHGYRIHSDRALPSDLEAVIADLVERVAAMEHGPDSETYDVYLCHSRRRYAFFAFLTRRTAASQAIGLSAAGNVFVSMTRLGELAANQGSLFAHSRFEGGLAFAIAHEIAHFRVLDDLGLPANHRLPQWKSEGWTDYQANLAAIRRDPAYDLASRIDLLDDPRYWLDPGLRARRFYAWQLVVEYLAEEQGYRFADLIQPSITEPNAREQMRKWRQGRR